MTDRALVAGAMLPVRRPLPAVEVPEVGRLRLGGPKGEKRPGKALDYFRATAPIRDDLDALIQVYGGSPIIPWQSPDGPQWQTVVTAQVLRIVIPRYQDAMIRPRYEAYNGANYMTRHCDGSTAWEPTPDGKDEAGQFVAGSWAPAPCSCDPNDAECTLVTRLKVILVGLPLHGVWRLDCHGQYAAASWPAQMELAEAMQRDRRRVTGTIRIESRVRRSAVHGKSLYKVPVLRLDEPYLVEFDEPAAEPIGEVIEAAELPAEPPPPPPAVDNGHTPALEGNATDPPDPLAIAYTDRDKPENAAALREFIKRIKGKGSLPAAAREMTLREIVNAVEGA